MTRLSQALRWWRGRKCECSPECSGCTFFHPEIIFRTSIPRRHFLVLLKAGRLRKVPAFAPLSYNLAPDEP